ncbi:hypothetical protein [Streptomyces sp. V1I1]|uniref:hypothetical protein n=1 Tax=Streptomyces sp. V1I1 TaxID=3042272 RepID=UPI0027843B78|nr:hypothetical protein [Streptomyces sp. V1I1]MDQ0941815.1 hypothetical protein [Streptomyces sp. V1I1]
MGRRHRPRSRTSADPDKWAALASADLASLAKRLSGTPKDWSSLHTLLETIPPGRWTTYGDVATVILTAAGRVSTGFRWTDPTRTDTPADVLAAEGIRFDGGTAAQEARPAGGRTPAPLGQLTSFPDACRRRTGP